jgi:hypothetical protein
MTTHTSPSQGSITDKPVMDIVDVGFYPSALSSFFNVPGAIRAQKRPRHCLAASSPSLLFRGAQLLLKRLSQSSAFETPDYHSGTAEPPAAAADLPGLVMTSLCWSRR